MRLGRAARRGCAYKNCALSIKKTCANRFLTASATFLIQPAPRPTLLLRHNFFLRIGQRTFATGKRRGQAYLDLP